MPKVVKKSPEMEWYYSPKPSSFDYYKHLSDEIDSIEPTRFCTSFTRVSTVDRKCVSRLAVNSSFRSIFFSINSCFLQNNRTLRNTMTQSFDDSVQRDESTHHNLWHVVQDSVLIPSVDMPSHSSKHESHSLDALNPLLTNANHLLSMDAYPVLLEGEMLTGREEKEFDQTNPKSIHFHFHSMNQRWKTLLASLEACGDSSQKMKYRILFASFSLPYVFVFSEYYRLTSHPTFYPPFQTYIVQFPRPLKWLSYSLEIFWFLLAPKRRLGRCTLCCRKTMGTTSTELTSGHIFIRQRFFRTSEGTLNKTQEK